MTQNVMVVQSSLIEFRFVLLFLILTSIQRTESYFTKAAAKDSYSIVRRRSRLPGYAIQNNVLQHSLLKSLPSETGSYPEQLQDPAPMYELTEIPGKGFGAIALRDILPGELIMEEKPLFSMSKKTWFTPSESYSVTRVEKEVGKLSVADQERFFALHGFIGHEHEIDNSKVDNSDNAMATSSLEQLATTESKNLKMKMPPIHIYRTNAYPMGSEKSGIFPLISRLNSDCSPNVHYNWNEQRGKSTVYSVSRITKGEEILNCYIGMYIPWLERNRYLWKNFGFDCSCKTCALKGDEREDSDKRRMSLESLDEMTVTAILEKKKNLALDLVQLRLKTLEEEGLTNAMTLFKCEYDAFLGITGVTSSTSALVDDISGSADYTSSRESNGEMLELSALDPLERAEAEEWLRKAYKHVVQAKGPESLEAHKCFYYLSIFTLL